jgi:hypothetical protein
MVDAQTHFIVGEVPVRVCSLEGGAWAPQGVSPNGVPKRIKLGELPQHNGLRFFCCGRSLKIHIGTKRELFTIMPITHFGPCRAHYTL